MKKYLFLILLVISNITQAQAVSCGEVKEVITQLLKNYKEQPIWLGKSETGNNFAILANPENKNWTMIQFNDTVACLILTGNDFKLMQEIKSKLNASSQKF